uniref:LAGLIDADG type homing endonuclease, ORF2 protein n=1 Tax=Yarrowia galli TaxID=197054 RepID=G4U512_9ASCO|nr:hypothetical protein CagaM_p17 [Yarrowia galli]CCC29064.1 LAGLIDADG type homing endonuclease, ORF2 protein [Yarrowia galli]
MFKMFNKFNIRSNSTLSKMVSSRMDKEKLLEMKSNYSKQTKSKTLYVNNSVFDLNSKFKDVWTSLNYKLPIQLKNMRLPFKITTGLVNKYFDMDTHINPMQKTKLTDMDKSIMSGMLLGDAYRMKSRKSNSKETIRISQSIVNMHYVLFTHNRLATLGLVSPYLPQLSMSGVYDKLNDNTISKWDHMDPLKLRMMYQLKPLKEMDDMLKMWYMDDMKMMPREYMSKYFTLESLAYWIQDDGANAYKNVKLHTNSFTYEDVIWLSEFINNKFNLESYVLEVKGYDNQYVMMIKDSYKLHSLIKEYYVNSMTHKLDHTMKKDGHNMLPTYDPLVNKDNLLINDIFKLNNNNHNMINTNMMWLKDMSMLFNTMMDKLIIMDNMNKMPNYINNNHMYMYMMYDKINNNYMINNSMGLNMIYNNINQLMDNAYLHYNLNHNDLSMMMLEVYPLDYSFDIINNMTNTYINEYNPMLNKYVDMVNMLDSKSNIDGLMEDNTSLLFKELNNNYGYKGDSLSPDEVFYFNKKKTYYKPTMDEGMSWMYAMDNTIIKHSDGMYRKKSNMPSVHTPEEVDNMVDWYKRGLISNREMWSWTIKNSMVLYDLKGNMFFIFTEKELLSAYLGIKYTTMRYYLSTNKVNLYMSMDLYNLLKDTPKKDMMTTRMMNEHNKNYFATVNEHMLDKVNFMTLKMTEMKPNNKYSFYKKMFND